MKFTCFFLSLFLFSQTAWALTGQDIIDKMDARDQGKTMHSIMKMTLIDKKGEETERIIETWTMLYDKEKNLHQSVMEFKSPATVKGTRFLQIEQAGRDDDQWIYLPALGQVRRIAASEGSSSFMGSDFTYDDMQLQNNRENEKHTLLREDTLGTYPCWVVESKSTKPDKSSYDKLVSWISKEHLIPLRVEFYNKKNGELLKIMLVKQNIGKIDGIWTVFETEMKNVRENHVTLLTILRNGDGLPFIEYNKKIDPRRFTRNFLQTGRAE
ncbi:MAG: outer membrane lipoprotein-sorting protein [Candidatus Marinimicrobia bacterium]|nr:outer membrane lipoprotein-sorting protein [Candidatus Neomarinimicrobiota bacterium]